jgi:hypothetical protein
LIISSELLGISTRADISSELRLVVGNILLLRLFPPWLFGCDFSEILTVVIASLFSLFDGMSLDVLIASLPDDDTSRAEMHLIWIGLDPSMTMPASERPIVRDES